MESVTKEGFYRWHIRRRIDSIGLFWSRSGDAWLGIKGLNSSGRIAAIKEMVHSGELIELGVNLSIVDKSGAWYSYQGDRIGQGKENVRIFLKENTAIAADIEARIREQVFPKQESKTADADEEKEAEVLRIV